MASPKVQVPAEPTREQQYVRSLIAQLSQPDTEDMITELLETSALSNDIHPIFARSQWDDLSHLDLLRIAPALVLASRMLTSFRAVHFWHALLRGPRRTVSYGGGEIRQRFDLMHDPATSLPPSEADLVLEMLAGMARKIRMSFKEQKSSHGYCTLLKRLWSPNDKPMLGIVVALEQLKLLELADKPWFFLLARWIHLAITLVHEVAHAVSAEYYGWRGEGYFGDNKFIEMGEAFVEWLIGGDLEADDEAQVTSMAMTEVGTSGRSRGYKSCGTSASHVERMPPSIHHWLVGAAYAWKLFLQKFWLEEMPSSAGMALQPARFGCGCARCPEVTDDQLWRWHREERACVVATWPLCPEIDQVCVRR
ncbi:hypothetical protein CLAFUW4_00216 [Fulvia fulva]|uniref:Uncharacterized protein n=1 Tax=Passalora fulva TaxID=5499 RepID=A0A9Q8L6N8_PASFU|nr:uncharacterized protein CLAFUR5_00216 [Fulvia fulva]KAK4636153.1 hypothetical protein CLAFUR4_00216 [Fulvia fulva]KAK4638161.1 hypothetical protein CLAFUR0_00217 [Fulvia fulva]UJO11809.1 hypothetical protein CLAFUR5_00216 [Fulvia fulva]WPV09532.1 hypothetical protein CLAFUW4_00216 [Fulvia fulva]WPV23727.1 hypothetical protein CLAFUW7_00219 [Fulvia fulva]